MSLSLCLTASRLVTAPRDRVWRAFVELMGGEEMLRQEGPGPSLELGFRPLGLRVVAAATGLESEPGRRVCWQGRAWGLAVRRVFVFRGAPGGTLVESREEIRGWPLLLLRPWYSPRAMGRANQAWLAELAARAEGGDGGATGGRRGGNGG